MHEAELQRILAFIDSYTGDNGFPPSYQEIAEECGLRSVGHVQYRIDRLVREGRVARSPGRARSLVVVTRKVDESATRTREHKGIKSRAAAFLKVLAGPRGG